jgi:hypothetical protein
MLKINQLAVDLAQLKKLSEEAEANVKVKVEEFMQTEEMQALNKLAEDSRVEYEEKRNEMLSEMQKQKTMTIKTEEGHNISRSILKRASFEDEVKVVEYLEKNGKGDLIKKVINKTPAKKFLMEELDLGNEVEGFKVEEAESLSVKLNKK